MDGNVVGSYQELRAVLPVHSVEVFRHNQDTLKGYRPGTVENEKPHRRPQCLGQELVSETGKMRVEAWT
jgi:hypothetical protein